MQGRGRVRGRLCRILLVDDTHGVMMYGCVLEFVWRRLRVSILYRVVEARSVLVRCSLLRIDRALFRRLGKQLLFLQW